MSHVSSIDLEINDLQALEKMCKEMGLTFVKDKKTYTWYGRFMGDYPLAKGMKVEDLGKCSHAIKVPGSAYEIGVCKQKDGTFRLTYDFWGPGKIISDKLGHDLEKLKQMYATNKIEIEAKRKGYTTQRKKLSNGSMMVTIGGFR